MAVAYILLLATVFQLASASAECISTFRVPVNSIPAKIDPHLGNEFDLNAVALQMYQGLTSFKSGIAPRPNLASWEIDYKRSQVTFNLIETEFSDASPVTGLDVARSILRSEKMGNSFSDVLKDFSKCTQVSDCPSIKILSKNRISFSIQNGAFELFLKKMAGMEGAIVKQEGDKLLGTAPFVVKKKDEQSILLKRWKKTANKNLFDCIMLVKNAV